MMTSAELAAHLEATRTEHTEHLRKLATDHDGWVDVIAELKNSPQEYWVEVNIRTADKKKKWSFDADAPVSAHQVAPKVHELAGKACGAVQGPIHRLQQAQFQRDKLATTIQAERMKFHTDEQRMIHAADKAREREARETSKRVDVAKKAPRDPSPRTMIERLGLSDGTA